MKYSQIEKPWQRYILKKYNICSSIMISAKKIVDRAVIKTNWMFIDNTLILDFSISPKKRTQANNQHA